MGLAASGCNVMDIWMGTGYNRECDYWMGAAAGQIIDLGSHGTKVQWGCIHADAVGLLAVGPTRNKASTAVRTGGYSGGMCMLHLRTPLPPLHTTLQEHSMLGSAQCRLDLNYVDAHVYDVHCHG